MTSKEFVSWLEGFLDATEDITPCAEKKIREKMKTIQDPIELSPVTPIQPICPCPSQPWIDPNPYPNYPIVTYCDGTGNVENIHDTFTVSYTITKE